MLLALLAAIAIQLPALAQDLRVEGTFTGSFDGGRLFAERLIPLDQRPHGAPGLLSAWRAESDEGGPVAVDSRGRFRHRVSSAGRWRLRYETPSGLHVLRDLDWVEHHLEGVELKVPAARATSVRVLDLEGRAIPGARLRLSFEDPWIGSIRFDAVTGAEGAADLALPRVQTAMRGKPIQIEVAAPGFVPRTLSPEEILALKSGRVNVELERGLPVDIVLRVAERMVEGAAVRRGSLRLPSAVTDQAGRARIWVAHAESELETGLWTAQAASWTAPVSVGVPPRSEKGRSANSTPAPALPWAIELIEEPCVGRVVAGEKPISSASVRLRGTDAVTRTDDAGRFCLPTFRVQGRTDLPANVRSEATLVVESTDISLRQASWADRALIRAQSELRMTVSVVDELGGPIAGANVRLSERPAQLIGIRVGWDPQWIEAATDADGRAVLGIARGAHVMEVLKEGRRSWFGPLAPFPEAWTRHEIRVEMLPGARHEGWVVDAADQPIENAEVFVMPMERVRTADRIRLWPEATTKAATDEEGRFEIADHPPGAVALVVTARGFVDGVIRGVGLAEAGGTLGTVVLDSGFDLEGRVVDGSGRPVSGVQVGLLPGTDDPPWRHRTDDRLTDSEGRFRFADLAAEERRLWLRHADYVGDESVVQVPTEGIVDFVLKRGLTVPVSVRFDDESRPVSARISVMQQDRSPSSRASIDLSSGVGALEGLRSGTYWVTVSGDQSDPLEFQARVVEQGDQQALDRVEILEGDLPVAWDGERLVVTLPAGVTVTGSVRTVDGDLVEEASVAADRKRVVTADGRFELRNLPARQVQLRVETRDFVPHHQTLELERDLEIDIELERGGTLTGLVTDPDGLPVANAPVRLERLGQRVSRRAMANTDAEGRYRIAGRPEGTDQLSVPDPRFRFYGPVAVEIGAGETIHDVSLSAGVRMFGQVIGLPEHLIGQAFLELRQETRASGKTSPILHDGSYEFVGLSPGPVQVRLGSGFHKPSMRTVQVPDRPEFEYDLELGRGSLRGVVLEGGLPQRDLAVALLPEGEMSDSIAYSQTGVDGDFQIEMLDEGRYELAVTRANALQHREEIWVSGDQEVVIHLQPKRVEGMVRGEDGLPIHGAQVVLSPANDASSMWELADARGVSDAAGRFTLAVAASSSDRYDLRVAAQGFASQVVAVDLGDSASVEVVLERQRRSLVIEWDGEGPPSGATTFVLDDVGRVLNQRDNAGYGGGWLVPDVPESAAIAVVMSSFTTTFAEIPRSSTSASADTGRVKVRMSWPATGSVLLKLEPPLRPMSEITVRLRDASGQLVSAPVGGRMRALRHWWVPSVPVATLPAGTWTLERVENGVATQSATFEVVAGARVVAPFR